MEEIVKEQKVIIERTNKEHLILEVDLNMKVGKVIIVLKSMNKEK